MQPQQQQWQRRTKATATSTLKIEQLSPACGAVLHGIDIRNAMPTSVMKELHNALSQYGVLFLRGQHNATDEDFVTFGQQWGELEGPHPIYKLNDESPIAVVKHDPDHPPDGAEWHTDCSWSQNPPFASLLWPKLLPPCGGDTLWLSSVAAFKALPPGMQADLRSLSAVHDLGTFRNAYATDAGDAMNAGVAKFGSAIHPIVRTHPVTGEPCLFVNEAFTAHVVGKMAAESQRLLQYLFSHINCPDFQVRWRWQLGDAALWDNRNTQHYAVADYAGQFRRMHRVTMLEDNIGKS